MLKLNQIYLGDSYELIRKIPDKSIDLIYTDIPYFYKGGGAKVSKLSERKVRNKEELINISSGIDYSIFDEFIRILKTINICIWCSREQMLDIMNYFNARGGVLHLYMYGVKQIHFQLIQLG